VNLWPVVAPLLQRAYQEHRRAWLDEASQAIPNIAVWPRRRTSKRKPLPGLIEVAEQDDG
jgi:hypothetical protein